MAECRYPAISRIRQLLEYDQETGVFRWKERTGPYSSRWNLRFAGKLCGTVIPGGYVQIKIDGVNILAHRIALALSMNWWPEVVDHINGDTSDNRRSNLRAVTYAMNSRNQKRHTTNTSGRTGVSWNRLRNLWVASIKMNGISHYLGSFESFDDAVDARAQAECRHGFTGRQ